MNSSETNSIIFNQIIFKKFFNSLKNNEILMKSSTKNFSIFRK